MAHGEAIRGEADESDDLAAATPSSLADRKPDSIVIRSPPSPASNSTETDEERNSATSDYTSPDSDSLETGDEVDSANSWTRKDPRKIARRYQLELCKKALAENVIVYLGTGCGKTHVAVLLMYEMGHLIRKPQKQICVFLATTVALVEQQARAIKDSVDFKVGIFCGGTRSLKTHPDWENEIEKYEVFVMTPQVLLRNLNHCFMKMEMIALLIFDECHHAQAQSHHPYAEIMKVFYDTNVKSRPRIFGMTASPIVGKGASNHSDLPKCINSLENMLDSKIYTVEEKDELELFFTSPKVRIYQYGALANATSIIHLTYYSRLEEIKKQCLSMLNQNQAVRYDLKSLLQIKKTLRRTHDNLIFCLKNLGVWGALQACQISLSGQVPERNYFTETKVNNEDNSLHKYYITEVASFLSASCTKDGFQSDLSCVEVLKEPFFSKKVLRLLGILSTFRLQPMKCIIFVNRIVIARSLSHILQNLKFLASWKCNFLVGVHSGIKSVSRETMNKTVDMFRSDKLNLLVATKVGEEGLDIQTCCLVIRFDLPETVASFIQSRGRARMPHSEYAFLVDSGNPKEIDLVKNFTADEDRMNSEIVVRTSAESYVEPVENLYRVDSSGACITAGYSVSLIHHYCSKLPRDEYFDPKPEFYFFDDVEGTICHILFPANAPINQIVSSPQSSIEAAKKDASLRACKELHTLGIFNDYLLQNKENDFKGEMTLVSAGNDFSNDEDSRTELHEMFVPSALAEPCYSSSVPFDLYAYHVNLIPAPTDRQYKRFGLFIRKPLSEDAEKMKIVLHLSHGRSIRAEFTPSGVIEFDEEKILQAHNFQEMFLKVILDRAEFLSEHVSLGRSCEPQSDRLASYLLLPVRNMEEEHKLTVDWHVITRCLSSPIFRTPVGDINGVITSGSYLRLADRVANVHDVKDSLVYAPHKKAFFFVSAILHEKNGLSPYKGPVNFVKHFSQAYGIDLLHAEQPLLKAKQLFYIRNLLCDRGQENTEAQELEEHFFEIPPELCQLKIVGFSKDIGSSISLLPSIMCRLESMLVAAEFKQVLSSSVAEASEVSAHTILEALTTENCNEGLSLERLEVLGDAFLKFMVGRHLFLHHDSLDEGELTRMRSNAVSNSTLYKLGIQKDLQVYIRDRPLDPSQFYTFGRPCPTICNEETQSKIHARFKKKETDRTAENVEVRCSRGHHWLQKKKIADVVEALVGAFIVDSGFKAAISFIRWIGIKVDFEVSQVLDLCCQSKRYLPLNDLIDVAAVEDKLGYEFVHKGLLLQALLHPSYNKLGGGCYQRLEYLGDGVLDYLITSYLYSVYPNMKPGQISDLRSLHVNNRALAKVSIIKSLYKYIIHDSSTLSEAVEKYVAFSKITDSEECILDEPKFPKVLGDLMESCIGAMFVDTGFDLKHLWNTMLCLLEPDLEFSSFQISPLRELQELCQCHNWKVEFPTTKVGNIFSVVGRVTGKGLSATLCVANRSRKDGIRNAAQQICMVLKDWGFVSKCKSVEKVLKTSCKMEAKLIGYDEAPLNVVTPDATGSCGAYTPGSSSVETEITMKNEQSEVSSLSGPCIRRLSQEPSSRMEAVVAQLDSVTLGHCSDTNLEISGGLNKRTPKSQLYEICVANSWRRPSFDCCKEEGPSHMKLYTVKVILAIEEVQDTLIECFGSPCLKKKAAEECAAEGAMWYLKQVGYVPSGY